MVEAGWPRPWIDNKPALWIGGDLQLEGDWLTFVTERQEQARRDYNCVVCGITLGPTVVLGHVDTFTTDGPACHPRCFTLALKFCPRFSQRPYTRARQTVGYVYSGEPWGYEPEPRGDFSLYALKRSRVRAVNRQAAIQLAKTDPLGEKQYART